MRKPYFKEKENTPSPLSTTVERQVRFEEIDPLGIVWHGRFASFFEDARVVLGERYGIGYMDLYSRGIMAPIKTMHVDFISPLRFRETITIQGRLHYSDAARINYDYIITNSRGETAATGYTVQMLLDDTYELFLTQPEYYRNFCSRWKAGALK